MQSKMLWKASEKKEFEKDLEKLFSLEDVTEKAPLQLLFNLDEEK